MNEVDDLTLEVAAEQLRSLHVAGNPLVLVNAWDVASAQEVVAAGALAVGTSSNAIASSLGEPDDNTMAIAHAFGAIERIASSVPVPVTADLEGGYGLDGDELVGGLLAAGAVGCNLEDSDHRRPGELLDPFVMAARLADVRRAASDCGVEIVVNARVDAMLHRQGSRRDVLREITRRARVYVEAGADCIYPIGVGDPAATAELVGELGMPVNVGLGPGVTVAEVAAAGASRISFGPGLHRQAMADLGRRAASLLDWRNGQSTPASRLARTTTASSRKT